MFRAASKQRRRERYMRTVHYFVLYFFRVYRRAVDDLEFRVLFRV